MCIIPSTIPESYSLYRSPLLSVFAGQVFDIAPEDFLELGQVPTSPMYCIGGILGSDSLPTPWLMYVYFPTAAHGLQAYHPLT
jgi:hypothetical protein